jgi:hypothetical protein
MLNPDDVADNVEERRLHPLNPPGKRTAEYIRR